MRDQMSSDAEHRNHPNMNSSSLSNDSISNSNRKPATLESVATISYKNSRHDLSSTSKPASVGPNESSNADDDRPALPATASWAKTGSGPSTPVMKSGVLPERSLTPDNFGPPLSVAVAAAAAQKQQQQAAAATKKKTEKKKRREQLNQKNESSSGSRPDTPSTTPSTTQEPETDTQTQGTGEDTGDAAQAGKKHPLFYDGLISFVLGDALTDMSSLLSYSESDDDMPVGVSALHDDEDGQKSSRANDEEQGEEETDALAVSALDFLTSSVPTPTYTGTFNPFAHQILRSTGSLFEAPARKCSRFGFAQI